MNARSNPHAERILIGPIDGSAPPRWIDVGTGPKTTLINVCAARIDMTVDHTATPPDAKDPLLKDLLDATQQQNKDWTITGHANFSRWRDDDIARLLDYLYFWGGLVDAEYHLDGSRDNIPPGRRLAGAKGVNL